MFNIIIGGRGLREWTDKSNNVTLLLFMMKLNINIYLFNFLTK